MKQKLSNETNQQQLVEYLLKENAEFKQLMLEQNKHMLEQNKHMIELAKNAGHNTINANTNNTNNTNNTTNNNQSFNLKFYLLLNMLEQRLNLQANFIVN